MGRPEYVPQLATIVARPPSGREWLHEIKYDGYRIGCLLQRGRVTLLTRAGNDWTTTFPEIVAAAQALPTRDALLDGEVAALLPDGRTSFQALQHALSAGSTARLVYFVFDLLALDGEPLDALPLETRKARLKALLERAPDSCIRYSDHTEGSGPALFEQACKMGLEGIVSKQRHLPYRAGRQAGWVKAKCARRQEFVVGGFTDPEGASRAGIGALLIGVYDGPRLMFSGKVGTGFTHAVATDLRRRLDAITQPDPPFDPPPERAIARKAHWVTPTLVCEVSFTNWTADNRVRHPSFQGLRADKKPRDVRREDPANDDAIVAPPTGSDSAPRRTRREPAPVRASSRSTSRDAAAVTGIHISHPDRMMYTQPALTKLDLARYYERMAKWMVPHVAGRPLSLVRCPDGLEAGCFYMKHWTGRVPAPLRRVTIPERSAEGEYLVADDAAALVGLAQMGVLEIHTWNTLADDLERPNRLVFDLDPGEGVTWDQIVQAANTVRDALGALDLDCHVKTTGGRGLHVVVPLVPQANLTDCLEFTRALSEAIERSEPNRYTTRFAKSARRGLILIDFLRNSRTSTSVAAFSTRARAGAPVSVPLSWDDLRPSLRPDELTVVSVPGRLARRTTDPWKSYWTTGQTLTPRLMRAAREVGGY